MKSLIILLIAIITIFSYVQTISRTENHTQNQKNERAVTDVSVSSHLLLRKLQKRLKNVEKELKNSNGCGCGCNKSDSSQSSSSSSQIESSSSSSSSDSSAAAGIYNL
jgi:hypothetical protein